MNLFLVPASLENVKKTIASGVSINAAEQFLNSSQLESLKKVLGNKKTFNCWDMTESLRPVFESMEKDDTVLLTVKSTGSFNYVASIIHKLESERLGDYLWSYIPGRPWKLIYVLDRIIPIEINKGRLVSTLGYKHNDAVAGSRRVRDEYLNKILGEYGSIPHFLKSFAEEDLKSSWSQAWNRSNPV
jgi:hypothetical protein